MTRAQLPHIDRARSSLTTSSRSRLMRSSYSLLIIALLLTWAAPVAAAPVALKGGEVHTVSGEVIEDGVIVIGDDGAIVSVGDASTSIPADAEVLDVTDQVVTPGLFDAHTMLGLVEIWAVDGSRDTDPGPGEVNAANRVADSFNARSAVIPMQRDGGITDVVIVPGGSFVRGQAAHVELAGSPSRHASIVTRSAAMLIELGTDVSSALKAPRGEAIAMLRKLYDDATFYLANRAKFDARQMRELSADRLDLEALGETVARAKPVYFEAHRASDIEAALSVAADLNLKPIITGGAEAWLVADTLAATGTPVILDPLANLPADFDRLGSRADNAALLEEAGVPVIISTFEAHNVRKLRQLAGNAVRAGMSHEAALRAVTLEAARAVGADATRGSIEVGKRANLVVWSGDPFELSTRVTRMMIGGEEVSLRDRQDALLERYRTLDRRGTPAPKAPNTQDDTEQ